MNIPNLFLTILKLLIHGACFVVTRNLINTWPCFIALWSRMMRPKTTQRFWWWRCFILFIMAIPITKEVYGQVVKRCRNEGTLSLAASNVMATSNITAFSGAITGAGIDGYYFNPIIGAKAGITDIIQFSIQTIVPINRISLGSTEVHLQLTTPHNDRLRFFGIALSVDVFLSTFADTLSSTASDDKPFYNPYIVGTLITDLDWIALLKNVPLKNYFSVSLADNPDLLYRYSQIACKAALEWKMYQHGLFINNGLAMYKEKPHRLNRYIGERSYVQRYAWIEPGARYRLWGKLSLVAAVYFPVYKKVKQFDPLVVEPIKVRLVAELPVFFTETNTEAIRTLVFIEKTKKKDKSGNYVVDGLKKSTVDSKFDVIFNDLQTSGATFDTEQNNEMLNQKRKEVQQKLEALEKLYEEIE